MTTVAALEKLHEGAAQNVYFDFQHLDSINSSGTRDWIQFIRKFEQGRAVTYINCPPDLITTFNNIVASVGNGTVESLQRAYHCPDCQSNQTVLLQKGKHFQIGQVPKEKVIKCPNCSNELEPEEAAEDYFKFLQAS